MSRYVTFTVGIYFYTSEMFDLFFIGKTMAIPEPRIETVEIPGRNGLLDLTDCLTGHALMKDYELDLNFMFNSRDESYIKTKLTNLCNSLNGHQATVTIVGTASFAYSGRVIVHNFRNENQLWFVDLKIKCLTPIDGNGGAGYQ